jgi:hypothetical protein
MLCGISCVSYPALYTCLSWAPSPWQLAEAKPNLSQLYLSRLSLAKPAKLNFFKTSASGHLMRLSKPYIRPVKSDRLQATVKPTLTGSVYLSYRLPFPTYWGEYRKRRTAFVILKVDKTKNEVGQKDGNGCVLCLEVWRSMAIWYLNMLILCLKKTYFSFRLLYS